MSSPRRANAKAVVDAADAVSSIEEEEEDMDIEWTDYRIKFNSNTDKPFSMMRWNNTAKPGPLQKRGIVKKAFRGDYTLDVCYSSNTPGFIVQEIVKTGFIRLPKYITNKKTQTQTIPPLHYWEVFYIYDNDCDNNNDGFSLVMHDMQSEGVVVQTGINVFYPYDKPVKINRDGYILESTKDYKKIFGDDVGRNKVRMALAMPASLKKIPMNNLTAHPNGIIRQTIAQWGSGDAAEQVEEGFPTNVIELIYKGPNAAKGMMVAEEMVVKGLDRPLNIKNEEDEFNY